MDPVAVSGVVSAVVSGAAGEAGEKLWDGLAVLVRRPFRDRHGNGVTEVAAVGQARGDESRVLDLARALAARAEADEEFATGLRGWFAEVQQAVAGAVVSNVISGGSQAGPVFQGRDFRNLTFNSGPPSSESG